MKKSCKSLLLSSAAALALGTPLLASAESQLTVGTGNASARLDFRVIIPRVLFLGVGTGSATLADNSTIDRLIFDYTGTPADVGSGTASAPQSVAVRVLGNNGPISLGAVGSGSGLTNGTDVIPWTQIVASSSDTTNLNVPAVGGSAAPAASGKITNRTANWSYSYANSAVVAPGTYDGQITYTASMP